MRMFKESSRFSIPIIPDKDEPRRIKVHTGSRPKTAFAVVESMRLNLNLTLHARLCAETSVGKLGGNLGNFDPQG